MSDYDAGKSACLHDAWGRCALSKGVLSMLCARHQKARQGAKERNDAVFIPRPTETLDAGTGIEMLVMGTAPGDKHGGTRQMSQ